jgi:hypothetical protein
MGTDESKRRRLIVHAGAAMLDGMFEGLSRRFIGSIAATMLVAISWSQPAGAAETVSVMEGDGFVRPQGSTDFEPAKSGASIAPGVAVRAGMGTAVGIKASDGVSIRLGQGSTVNVRPASILPAEHPGAGPLHAFQVLLIDGEIDLQVRDPAMGVLVQLPNGRSLGVWRGEANISIQGDDVAIGFYDGTAIAGSASKWKALGVGTATLLSKRGDASVSKSIPAQPDWDPTSTIPAFAMVRGEEMVTVGLAWKPVVGSQKYRVEIAHDRSMLGTETVLSSEELSLRTEPLESGMYVARVRAISSEGIAGPPSTTKAVRIARMRLPPSAIAAPGSTIVLPPNAGIPIDDPRGLEMATAFDGSVLSAWNPAPKMIELGAATRREVHIRHVGSLEETRFVLVKRELRAAVSFTPKPAHWPKDPVDLVVKVADLSGYLDASKENLEIDVRVGITKEHVEWTHEGGTWRGRLEPMKGDGPWVIRVNVADSAGVAIGANLLDVDGAKPAVVAGFAR